MTKNLNLVEILKDCLKITKRHSTIYEKFENFGYKDITKDKPIDFIECLGGFFESTFPYRKRFYKQEGNITIEVKIGNCHDICFISSTCYYPKGLEKFEVCAPKDYVNELFTQTLNAVKLKIKENLNN